MTDGFRSATGQWTGSFRNVGEQLSGSFRSVSDRMPGRGGGRDQWGGSDPYATQVDMSDPYATQAGQGRRGGPDYGRPGYGSGGRGPGGPGGRGPGGPGGRGPGGPGRPGGPRVRRKGDWWRHWTWKKALAVSGAVFGIFILAVIGTLYSLYNSTQIPTAYATGVNDQSSTVYYSDGTTVLGTFSVHNRTDLTYSQIPLPLQNAVLAAEDRSFFTEGAISPTGILRAAWDDLTSSGGNLSGGSTITQEFVRQYYGDIGTQQTTSRKIKEIFVAMKLSKSESKQWILQHYMNIIYLGENSYGVAAAAQTYFGEPVGKLSISQDAVIAAIIQQPTNYPVKTYRPELIKRWQYVLQGMLKMGAITPAQAAAAKFPKLQTDDSPNYVPPSGTAASSTDPWAGYDMDVVANELTGVDGYTIPNLDTGGYKIVSTFSKPDEAELYKAVQQNVQQMNANGGALPSYARVGAELQDPQTGKILAIYGGPGMNESPAQCAQSDCQVNTAVYAREQVGSSFKPYVLAQAVLEGMNVQKSTLNGNSPLWVPPDYFNGTDDTLKLSTTNTAQKLPGAFKFNNDCLCSLGALSVQNAFAQSSNTAYTDLAHRVGTRNIINLAQEMGVDTTDPYPNGSGLAGDVGQIGIALGTAPLTINEQDTMLATIDNGGMYHQAHVIVSVTAPGGTPQLGKYQQHQVLTPAQASEVQYAMQTVVKSGGTAGGIIDQASSRPIIAKTGTTSSFKTAFFIGAIPQDALTIGIFTKKQSASSPETLKNLGNTAQGSFGGYWPAKIWNTYADAEFANLQVDQFLQPVFSGQTWNQVPKPPAKKKPNNNNQNCQVQGQNQGGQGGFFPCPGKHHKGGGPTPTPPVSTPTSAGCLFPGGPGCPTTGPSSTPTIGSSPTPTATATLGGPGNGGGGKAVTTAAVTSGAASGAQASLAAGGMLLVLPGSLLWNRVSRRRRRKRGPEN
jgi:membrane peptidoglycan carboxypeptidase